MEYGKVPLLVSHLNKTICCQIMKVLGPTITDNVFVIRSRKKMASLEHFKCAGSENVTSFIVMAKTEVSHEQGIYIKTRRSVYRLKLYDSDFNALIAF